MLLLSCCRSMSGVRISGTRSRKYPVCGLPLTRTPTSRRRSTQRHTVERETPICLAMRAPLMAMVALFANNVSREASRLSVVPERELEAMEVGRSLFVLDAVHKQTEIRRRRGMGQRARRKEIRAGFGVGAHIFQRNAPGNLDHAVGTQSTRQLDALFGLSRRHVIQEHRFRTRGERLAQFPFVAHFDLNWQDGISGARRNGFLVSRQRIRF